MPDLSTGIRPIWNPLARPRIPRLSGPPVGTQSPAMPPRQYIQALVDAPTPPAMTATEKSEMIAKKRAAANERKLAVAAEKNKNMEQDPQAAARKKHAEAAMSAEFQAINARGDQAEIDNDSVIDMLAACGTVPTSMLTHTPVAETSTIRTNFKFGATAPSANFDDAEAEFRLSASEPEDESTPHPFDDPAPYSNEPSDDALAMMCGDDQAIYKHSPLRGGGVIIC